MACSLSSQAPQAPQAPLDVRACVEALEAFAHDRALLADVPRDLRDRLLVAAGRVSRPLRHEKQRASKAFRRIERREKKAADRDVRAGTEIRAARREAVFVAPPRLVEVTGAVETPELSKPRNCYVCKAEFTKIHFFYDAMCESCATLNYEKRFQTAPLHGRTALITGARLKIGYHAALMMLRAGARVIVTTRFPHDAAARYAREHDFAEWSDRLQVYGLDLRHSPSVEAFTRFVSSTERRLDILINNAAQTVRRPAAFYAHLVEQEATATRELPVHARALVRVCDDALARLSFEETHDARHLFPTGRLDADLQQIDLRKMNSWRMTLADVPTPELLEVQLVNAVAPFILCSKLKPLMVRDFTGEKHIVNVSAMEGSFSRRTKTDKHPHTNMAKAALNMMTLTSAPDYVKSGVFMNAVDTGWVTDEDPAHISARKQDEHDFQPPLDVVDGAARICDPFFAGLTSGTHAWGQFFKDYKATAW